QVAVLNHDDAFTASILDVLPPHTSALTWSLADSRASVHASRLEISERGMKVSLNTPWGAGVVQSPLNGSFNASNLLAVLTTVLACESVKPDFDLSQIMAVISSLEAVPGRMQVIAGFPVTAVIDYAHTPDGLEKALAALREHFSGEIICV